MKKIYFYILSGIIFSNEIFSQNNLSFYPNDTVYHDFAVDNTPEVLVDMFNITGDSITIKWQRLSNTLPNTWDYSICDMGTCYVGIPLSGTMNKMSTMDTAFFKLTIFHNNVPGQGKVVIRVEPKPGEYDTVVFQVSNFPLGIDNDINENTAFSFFPNPASGNIFININIKQTENPKVVFTNVLGEIVKQENIFTNKTLISISDLPEGIYFLSLQKDEMISETKKVIIAR